MPTMPRLGSSGKEKEETLLKRVSKHEYLRLHIHPLLLLRKQLQIIK
jgi:hypothetical protein